MGNISFLHFGIPVIVTPFLGDQFDWAVRVSDAGVGVQLLLHQWTSSYLKQSVKMIENGGYRKRAEKMSVLMRRAGGAQKAADLVELYATYKCHTKTKTKTKRLATP